MAVVNKFGTVNNFSSNDNLGARKISENANNGAFLHYVRDTIETLANDTAASVYRLARIPSNAILKEVIYDNDALTGGTSYSLGFYDVPETNSGAVISAAALVSAVSLVSASTGLGSNGMAAVDIANKHKKVFELAGLTADPKKLVDVAFTANTPATVAGTITVTVVYSLV